MELIMGGWRATTWVCSDRIAKGEKVFGGPYNAPLATPTSPPPIAMTDLVTTQRKSSTGS